jgi:hypothetical protein
LRLRNVVQFHALLIFGKLFNAGPRTRSTVNLMARTSIPVHASLATLRHELIVEVSMRKLSLAILASAVLGPFAATGTNATPIAASVAPTSSLEQVGWVCNPGDVAGGSRTTIVAMGTIVEIDLTTMTGLAATATVHVLGAPATVGATVVAVGVQLVRTPEHLGSKRVVEASIPLLLLDRTWKKRSPMRSRSVSPALVFGSSLPA